MAERDLAVRLSEAEEQIHRVKNSGGHFLDGDTPIVGGLAGEMLQRLGRREIDNLSLVEKTLAYLRGDGTADVLLRGIVKHTLEGLLNEGVFVVPEHQEPLDPR